MSAGNGRAPAEALRQEAAGDRRREKLASVGQMEQHGGRLERRDALHGAGAGGPARSSSLLAREQAIASSTLGRQRALDAASADAAPSLAAVNDQAVRQIVGGHGNAHAIARQHADVMAAHATRQLSPHDGATLVDADVVLAATKCVLNHAFHLQQIALTHWLRFMKIYAAAAGARATALRRTRFWAGGS